MTERNISINLIYYGLHHIIWVIDKLGLDYMVNWRNQMSMWQLELKKRYNWIEENV